MNPDLSTNPSPTPASESPEKLDKGVFLVAGVVVLGAIMSILDITVVSVAIPTFQRVFDATPAQVAWTMTGYTLALASVIPLTGWAADRFGTKRLYLLAVALFTAGSVLCAAATSLEMLVLFRVLQGLGGGMLMPLGMTILTRAAGPERVGRVMAVLGIPMLLGPIFGPIIGGALIESASWHWIFLINLPVGLIGLVATQRFMPDARAEQTGRFDLWGYALLAFGMVAISLAIEGGSDLGLRQAGTLVLGVFGFAALVVYWLHAVRHPQPLFSTQLFRVRTLSVGLLGNLFCRLGSGAMPFLIPISLQISLGYSPLQAGLMMLPTALAGMAMKRVATPLILRFGYRNVLVGNTAIIGLLMASFALATPGEPIWLRVLQLAAFGAFNSLQFTAMNTITLKDLDGASASSGNSLLSMVQMLAMSLGVAVAGAVLSGFSAAFGGTGTPGAALEAFQATFVTVGLITLASAAVFWQLPAEARAPQLDGPEVSGHG